MPDQIITEQNIRHLKRQAKKRAREDKNQTYMQHLEAVSREQFGVCFEDLRASGRAGTLAQAGPLSFYLQACQDAYFDL